MGIFDGILICSDWDRTLYDGETVPEVSRQSIEYFIREGGLFSISSGRNRDFLLERIHLVRPNTYCICYGGSLICDIESGDIIHEGIVDYPAYDIVDKLISTNAKISRINVSIKGDVIHYTKDEYLSQRNILPRPIYKVTINGEDETDGEAFMECAQKIGSDNFTLARSFCSYIEIMKTEYTKGISAKLLKEKVGARVLVGVGDYENDIPLFEGCDLSFAVGNAIDKVKKLANRVTEKTVYNGAIAEVIESLKSDIENEKT